MKTSNNIKYIDLKEFLEKGYLQELNRRFLHPLGLALEVIVDDNKNVELNGIWDYRNDPEGIKFDIANSSKERIENFKKNADFIESEFLKRNELRSKEFGSNIEPIIIK